MELFRNCVIIGCRRGRCHGRRRRRRSAQRKLQLLNFTTTGTNIFILQIHIFLGQEVVNNVHFILSSCQKKQSSKVDFFTFWYPDSFLSRRLTFSVKGGEARSLECFVPDNLVSKHDFPLVESQNHNVMESNVLLGKDGSSSSLHGPSGADADRRSQSLSGNQPVKLFFVSKWGGTSSSCILKGPPTKNE